MNTILKKIRTHFPIKQYWETSNPIHAHDCDNCEFLGTARIESRSYDLYYCDQGSLNQPTFIARYGSDGKYSSGFDFIDTNPGLAMAFTRKMIKDYRK